MSESGHDQAGRSCSTAPAEAEPAACCRESVRRYVTRHRAVATCDRCGTLLLGYGNDRDYDETRRALSAQRVPFFTMRQGAVRVIGKRRPGRGASGRQ